MRWSFCHAAVVGIGASSFQFRDGRHCYIQNVYKEYLLLNVYFSLLATAPSPKHFRPRLLERKRKEERREEREEEKRGRKGQKWQEQMGKWQNGKARPLAALNWRSHLPCEPSAMYKKRAKNIRSPDVVALCLHCLCGFTHA